MLSALGVSTRERIARGDDDDPKHWGTRTYTEARIYDEYATVRGWPTSRDLAPADNIRRYLRKNGETLADAKRRAVRVTFGSGNTLTVPRALWDASVSAGGAAITQAPSGTAWAPAKTVKQATEWAQKNLGIDYVDYAGFDIELANDVNRTLEQLRRQYPQVQDTKIVSTTQNMFNIRYEDKLREMAERFKQRGYSDADAMEFAKRYVKKRRVEGNMYACSTDASWGRCEGITFNKKWASDYDAFKKSIASDIASGYHPIGTESPASVLTHEFGHQIDNFLQKKGERSWIEPMFADYRKQATTLFQAGMSTKQAYGSLLSEYGAKNSAEFFAEAFAEYNHSPTPRAIAKAVGDKLTEIMKTLK